MTSMRCFVVEAERKKVIAESEITFPFRSHVCQIGCRFDHWSKPDAGIVDVFLLGLTRNILDE